MDEPLPDMHINVRTPLREFLDRMASIAQDSDLYNVRLIESFLGDEGHDILNLAAKDSSPHQVLCGHLIIRPNEPGRVTVEVRARGWYPVTPPRYQTYCNAAREIFDPLIATYNRVERKRLSLRIQSQEDAEPRLPPVAAKLFKHFIDNANRSMLHPNDWKRFYRFVQDSKLPNPLSGQDMAFLLVKKGFSEDYANEIGGVYEHLCEYKKVCTT